MESGLAAVTLALVHVLAGKLRFLEGIPRSRWLSLAGGISVAYVFARLLPELAEAQERLGESAGGVLARLEHHAYLLALAGLAIFYGVPPDGCFRSSWRCRRPHSLPCSRFSPAASS